MADKLMRAQVTLHDGSGLAEDAVVNTFHFDGDDFPGGGDAIYHDVVDDGIVAFYNKIGKWLSSQLSGSYTLKIYDMRDPETRVPEYVVDRSIGGFSALAEGLPAEVAIVGSFRAALTSGVPVGTRRGRIFLGPLNTGTMVDSGGRIRVNNVTMTDLRDALSALGRLDIPAASQMSVRHSIYSPTWFKGRPITAKGSPAIEPHALDEAFNDVVFGWVDDAFDTQRRRGEKPQTRLTYDVAL